MRTIEIVIIGLVAATLAIGGVLSFVVSPPRSPCSDITGSTRSITIVASLTGFNDSEHQSGQWPVVNVHQCDKMIFTIVNHDTQTHGFSISSYSNAGVELVGGASQTLPVIQATRVGQFRIYCSSPVICTVHAYMQNGLLIVD